MQRLRLQWIEYVCTYSSCSVRFDRERFREANELASHQRVRWSSPVIDIRSPRGVTSALSASWIGIFQDGGYLMEKGLTDGSGTPELSLTG
ncbi:hypothetical protein EVAR_64740_1 [Eumeta japonica]|uniref:Uncharacterized protein n=1 Tax=Eumeta variegata TaxID=151549 RepID=A0A4C1Z395_EUMVA|nr:hypothetical protein EVAR_64740_1 [Eumeta japonica]